MNEVTSDENGKSCCAVADSVTPCCQPEAGNVSSCCNPGKASHQNGKTMVSVIIIMAAIAVGTNSFLSGNSAQSYTAVPAKSFSSGLTEIQNVAAVDSYQGKPQTKPEEILLNRVLDSLQSLDTLAADKDVVFLVLSGEAEISTISIPKQLGTVANNLSKSGQKVAVFTLKSSSSDYNQLVRHFSVKTFPSVVILGRLGSASAVVGEITEAGLYNAFVLASKPASCCPTQGSESCCPK